jgi:ribonuclease HI
MQNYVATVMPINPGMGYGISIRCSDANLSLFEIRLEGWAGTHATTFTAAELDALILAMQGARKLAPHA